MNSLKKIIVIMASVIALSASGIAPAVAAGAPQSDGMAELREFFSENGVPELTQKALVLKVQSGGMLDSARGIEPDRKVTSEKGDSTVTRNFYADGSVSVVTADIPTDLEAGSSQVSARGTLLQGCVATGGTGWITYKNCTVQGDNGQIFLKFKVDYQKYSSSTAAAQILRSYDHKSSSHIGWRTTDPVRTTWKPLSSVGSKAIVRYFTKATSLSGLSSIDFYTAFYLDNRGNWSILL